MTLLSLIAAIATMGCGRIGFDGVASDGADASPCAIQVHGETDAELRTAIQDAPDGATVCIDDGVTVTLDTSLTITRDVTVTGNASVCGTRSDRIWTVESTGYLHLVDLKICRGHASDGNGGAVLVSGAGRLDVDRVTFADNDTTSDAVYTFGGAIAIQDTAVLNVRRSLFLTNSAINLDATTGYARGGAIALGTTDGLSSVRASITDTSFEANSATDVGGAIFMAIDGANLTLDRLLFSNNTSNQGGALDLNCVTTGTVRVTSSTFANNLTTGGSGAIFGCGTINIDLQFDSFVGNTGSVVDLAAVTGHVKWTGSALVVSAPGACSGSGDSESGGFNIINNVNGRCPFDSPNDRTADPGFSPLADNGGPTQTLGLNATSMAVDAGGPACPTTDQRGSHRPNASACDAGAFER